MPGEKRTAVLRFGVRAFSGKTQAKIASAHCITSAFAKLADAEILLGRPAEDALHRLTFEGNLHAMFGRESFREFGHDAALGLLALGMPGLQEFGQRAGVFQPRGPGSHDRDGQEPLRRALPLHGGALETGQEVIA